MPLITRRHAFAGGSRRALHLCAACAGLWALCGRCTGASSCVIVSVARSVGARSGRVAYTVACCARFRAARPHRILAADPPGLAGLSCWAQLVIIVAASHILLLLVLYPISKCLPGTKWRTSFGGAPFLRGAELRVFVSSGEEQAAHLQRHLARQLRRQPPLPSMAPRSSQSLEQVELW